MFYRLQRVAFAAALAFIPRLALACACGCGVFDVQTSSMMPTGTGGTAWLEYDFMNQDRNWSHSSSAPADNNDDKVLRSHFIVAGGEYMFSRAWGMMAEVPYTDRYFKTTDDNTGNIVGFNHAAFGDVRISGVYSGFSPDMSTGVTFGLKLPTGDYSYSGFDRDTAIGSGSTDLLLGAYHMGALTKSGSWNWFANIQLDQPFLITAGYRPGSETETIAGVYYNNWDIGNVHITPILQAINSYRLRDRGPAASPDGSGYERVLFAPGIEAAFGSWKLYTDVALPVYQYVNGNQIVADEYFKISISKSF